MKRLTAFALLALAVQIVDPASVSSQDKQSPFGRKKPSDPKEEKAPLPKSSEKAREEYAEKIAKTPPQDAKAHLDLGKWCKARGLKDEAATHFTKALEMDPTLEEAKKEMGWKKEGEHWISPEELKKREASKDLLKDAIPLEVTLACEVDVTKERLTEMADLFAGFSDDIWFATEANFYIKSVNATDGGLQGNVRVRAAYVEENFAKGGGMTFGRIGTSASYMEVAGKCSVFTFVHEGGHMWLGLPDEYKNKGGGCPPCLMVGGNMEGFGPGKWKFCDASNHKLGGESCWSKIKAKFPNVKYPNPAHPCDLPVQPVVTVNNTGK